MGGLVQLLLPVVGVLELLIGQVGELVQSLSTLFVWEYWREMVDRWESWQDLSLMLWETCWRDWVDRWETIYSSLLLLLEYWRDWMCR